jgi:hypothetical protein
MTLKAMNEERDTVLFPAQLRGKTHSSLCGQKAYLNFEVKDAPGRAAFGRHDP